MEQETRINAAIAEMQNTINALIQRNINLAGDLAVALAQLKEKEQDHADTN